MITYSITAPAGRIVSHLVPVLALLLFVAVPSTAQQRAFIVEIKGEVDGGMGPYVERAITTATEELGGDELGLLLLHVNTFGGRVDIATQIRDAVIRFPGRSVAFVDRRAISAGALISIAADEIYMAPGSSIGAATPVTQTGETASAKIVSYMRGEMRGTAEENGRNPVIAEAMVDESVELDSLDAIVGSRRPLTLSANDAIEVGYANGMAGSIDEVLEALGYEEALVETFRPNAAEALTGFLSSPLINSILIMLGMGGLFYAVKTGHFGTGLVVGLSSLGLFFGSQYLADLASVFEMVLFVAGVILLLVEVFVVPGFGIAGISGILLMVTGLFLALIGSFDLITLDNMTDPLYTLAGAFAGFFVLAWAMYRFLPHSSRFRRFALMGESVSGRATSGPDEVTAAGLVGETGTVTSTLRPAGVVTIDGREYEVVSEEGLIRSGEEVVVRRVEGRRILVGRVEHGVSEKMPGEGE